MALGGLLMVATPSTAFAHDNLGGDELAVANWMLVAAMVTIVIALLWGLWAFKSGQFTNVEESKYTMLDTADDYDAIMAEAEQRELVAKAATEAAQATKPAAESAVSKSERAGSTVSI